MSPPVYFAGLTRLPYLFQIAHQVHISCNVLAAVGLACISRSKGLSGTLKALPDAGGQPPSAFESRQGEWLVVPLYHIFGSEELSRSAPAIAELSPEPYVALNPEDASSLGNEVELFGHRLPVKLATDLLKGLAGVPAGVPPFAGLDLPAWSRISRLP
jgi:hypothetical protein